MEERKSLNISEEQEAIGKEKTPGDQGQKETFDAPLELISTNWQVAEQGKHPNPSEEQEPIGNEITLRYQIQKKILSGRTSKWTSKRANNTPNS